MLCRSVLFYLIITHLKKCFLIDQDGSDGIISNPTTFKVISVLDNAFQTLDFIVLEFLCPAELWLTIRFWYSTVGFEQRVKTFFRQGCGITLKRPTMGDCKTAIWVVKHKSPWRSCNNNLIPEQQLWNHHHSKHTSSDDWHRVFSLLRKVYLIHLLLAWKDY